MTNAKFLDRRLIFFVGKGGVGKSTLATALSLAAVRRRKRVLMVSLDFEDRGRSFAGLRPPEGTAPVEVLPGLFRLNVVGNAALEEYLQLVIPVRRVLRAVFDSKVYQYFVAAAPGLKELMAIGKIWYEVDRGRWDLVIVDSPATGHALQYLRMPKTAYETFTTGMVHREAKRIWDLLCDPAITAVSVVTVAEELPVNETVLICRQLCDDLKLPPGPLIVNRFHSPEVSAQELEDAARVWRHGSSSAADALCEAALAAAREEVGWGAINERYRSKLAAETRWRPIVIPFLFREEFGFADVECLSQILEDVFAPTAKPRRVGASG